MSKIWRGLEALANLILFPIVLFVLIILYFHMLILYPFIWLYHYFFIEETRNDAAEESYTLREDQGP